MDVLLGDILGTGTFSTVFEASISDKLQAAKVSKGYALKRLNNNSLLTTGSDVAVSDFVFEASLLMQLPPHDNIVTLFGVSDRFFEAPDQGFFVMQRLVETLDQRILRWKRYHPSNSFSQRRSKRYLAQIDRVETVGTSIASALSFLHRNGLLYRDLKLPM